MIKLLKNPWVKIVVFLISGAILYFISNRLIDIIKIDRLRNVLGVDAYRIISRIIYICFGLTFFAIANKVIRGKDLKEIFTIGTPKLSCILKYILIGTLFPVLLLSFLFLILVYLGFIKVSGLSDSMSILGFISISLSVIITALFEELTFRSFFLKVLTERYNYIIGCIISSILFSLIHLSSGLSIIGFINLFLLASLFAVLNIRAKSVWPSIFAHFSWNFYHCVILSLKMYGGIYYPHLMELKVEEQRIVSGSSMGFEESILTTMLLLVISIYSYKTLRELNKNAKS